MMLLMITYLITTLAAEYIFPIRPSGFKTRIFGIYHTGNENVSYSIEQNYVFRSGNESGSTQYTTKDTLRGLILDTKLWHSIEYNTVNCSMHPLPPYFNNQLYQAFNFFQPNEIAEQPALASFIDVFKLFQQEEVKPSIKDTEGENVVFSYDGEKIDYIIDVYVSKEFNSIVKVVFKKNDTVVNTMHYGEIIEISNSTDNFPFLIPPHDVFCKSTGKDRKYMPYIDSGGFYSMDVVISTQFIINYDFSTKITISEYKHENLISVGYNTPFANTIENMNLVHNYNSGIYANVSQDEGNCTLYRLKFRNPNSTIEQKKAAFRDGVLRRMNFIHKIYVLEFWQVIQNLDRASEDWQYQGVRTIDSTLCNVWSYTLGKSYIAEIAFSYHRKPLRQGSSRINRSVPVAVNLFRRETSPYEPPSITYRISNYKIDSNPVETEMLYDTSLCYLNAVDTSVVQFNIDVPYSTVVEFGVGNVARALVKSLVEKVNIEHHQVHHISLSSAPKRESRITFTIYRNLGDKPPAPNFRRSLEKQINGNMKLVFSNPVGTSIQMANTVPGSLVFNYKPSGDGNHWSVSIAATISMCIGTMFIGIVIGVISINCWKNKRNKILKTDDSLPNYRRFNNEDIEEVDIGV